MLNPFLRPSFGMEKVISKQLSENTTFEIYEKNVPLSIHLVNGF